MANLETILEILAGLQAAYPHFRPANPQATLDLYVKHLSRFSRVVLQQAADQLTEELKFYPSVAELVQAARKIERRGLRPAPVDRLAERRHALEEACYQEGSFYEAEWEALAVEFDACGRTSGAEALRSKAANMAEWIAEGQEYRDASDLIELTT